MFLIVDLLNLFLPYILQNLHQYFMFIHQLFVHHLHSHFLIIRVIRHQYQLLSHWTLKYYFKQNLLNILPHHPNFPHPHFSIHYSFQQQIVKYFHYLKIYYYYLIIIKLLFLLKVLMIELKQILIQSPQLNYQHLVVFNQ